MDFIKNNIYPVIFIATLAVFRLILFFVELNSGIIPHRPTFAHVIPWGNLDGMHYLSIAENGYVQFEQAFFPLFPLLIRGIAEFFSIHYVLAALILVYGSFVFATIALFELACIDFKRKQAVWVIIFFLTFPSAFFLLGIYTESLFLGLILSSFVLMRKNKFVYSSIFAGLASATRIIGIFILPALLWELYVREKKLNKKFFLKAFGLSAISVSGFLMYCGYLWKTYGDPLMFIHSQPAFGAGRSGGEIILLPQVLWRYAKIFMTVPPSAFDWWVALLEILMLGLVVAVLYVAFKKRVRFSYIIFAACALIFPTLSGTLSSLPRYALVCFAIYFGIAAIKRTYIRYLIIFFSIMLEGILASLFLRGYFIS